MFCEKYSDCANVLHALNYNTVVFDWRGQGLSSRALPDRHKGHVDSYDEYVGDLEKVLTHAAHLYGNEPIYLLAHSMGGHVALRTLAQRPDLIRAAILSAPMVDIARSRLQFGLFRLLSSIAVRPRSRLCSGKRGQKWARSRLFPKYPHA